MSESLDLIKNTIKVLKEEINMLEKQIKNYELEIMANEPKEEKKISVHDEKEHESGITFGVSFEDEFNEYMLSNLGLSERTAKSYIFALKKIKDDMNEILKTNFKKPLFYINDYHELQKLIDMFEDSTDLREINYRGHNLYSAAYNNYYRFLETKK